MRRLPFPIPWRPIVALIAVADAFLVGYALSPSKTASASRTLTAGDVTIGYAAPWRPAHGGAGLDGPGGSRLRISRAATEPLPGDPPARVDAEGSAALVYRPEPGTQAWVFTLHDGRRLAVTCHTAVTLDVCGPLLAGVRVTGAVDPVPRTTVAVTTRDAIARLDAAARAAHDGLASSRTGRRAAAAGAMSRAYADLAQALTTAARSQPALQQTRLLGAARAAGRAATDFAALAAAARTRRHGRWEAARRTLHDHERALRSALAALRDDGYVIDTRSRA